MWSVGREASRPKSSVASHGDEAIARPQAHLGVHQLLRVLRIGLGDGGQRPDHLLDRRDLGLQVALRIGRGFGDEDFMRLLTVEAEAAGLDIGPEDAEVGDGLS